MCVAIISVTPTSPAPYALGIDSIFGKHNNYIKHC